MRTKRTCIAILLAFGFLTGAASADQSKSCRITLGEASKIGNAELRPGDYKVVVDAPKVVLTDLKTGKSMEFDAKVENTNQKFAATEVHSNRVDGVNQISEIRIGGSTTKVAFN